MSNANILRAGAVFLVLAAILTVVGCDVDISSDDKTDERKVVLDTDLAFSAMSVEKGMAEAFDAFMADNATMYRNGHHPFFGRQNINAIMPGPEGGTLEWEPYFAEVAKSGDLAYTLGNYTFTSTDSTGTEQKSYGHYVSIWKKQEDGSWKWVFDSGVDSPAPEVNQTD